jgi:tripeptidyl-peptidase-1
MKLGLQGTTLVFASGDDGVARRSGPCLGPDSNVFVPDAQGGCPYITAIGSTYLPPGAVPGDDEVATTSFSSGGGFSNIYTTPDYQSEAVSR